MKTMFFGLILFGFGLIDISVAGWLVCPALGLLVVGIISILMGMLFLGYGHDLSRGRK